MPVIGPQGFIQGGRERGDFPTLSKIPPPPPPPQHKYYSKVVLKHKQQQSDICCSKKWYATVQKHLEFFPKAHSSCQSIGHRHCFLVGGGASDGFPPIFEKSCMQPWVLFASVGGNKGPSTACKYILCSSCVQVALSRWSDDSEGAAAGGEAEIRQL